MGYGLLLSFKKMKESELVTFTGIVVQKTTTESSYAFISAEATELKTQLAAYIVAISNATLGGKDRMAAKKVCYGEVIRSLTTIGRLIEIKANGDDDFIQGAGFSTRSAPSSITSISTPYNLEVKNLAKDGLVKLKWQGAAEALTFGIEHRRVGDTDWKNGSYTAAHEFVFDKLPQGIQFEFRLKGLGTDGLTSEYSNIGSVYVA